MQRTLKKYFILASVFVLFASIIEAEAESASEASSEMSSEIGSRAGAKSASDSVSAFVYTEEKIREEMLTISRELGVTCTECHNVQNFKSDEKKSFRVAREHIKLTKVIKEHGFDGDKIKKNPTSTCFMCHRGKLNPDFLEPKSNIAK